MRPRCVSSSGEDLFAEFNAEPSNPQTTNSAMRALLIGMVNSNAAGVKSKLVLLEKHVDAKMKTVDIQRRKEVMAQFLQIKHASLSLSNAILKMCSPIMRDERAEEKKKAGVEADMQAKKRQIIADRNAGKQPTLSNRDEVNGETHALDMDSIKREVDACGETSADGQEMQSDAGQQRMARERKSGYRMMEGIFTEPAKKTQSTPASLHDVWYQEGHAGPGTLTWLWHVFKQHGIPACLDVLLQSACHNDLQKIGDVFDHLDQSDLETVLQQIRFSTEGEDAERIERTIHSVRKAVWYQRQFDEEEAEKLREQEGVTVVAEGLTGVDDRGSRGRHGPGHIGSLC